MTHRNTLGYRTCRGFSTAFFLCFFSFAVSAADNHSESAEISTAITALIAGKQHPLLQKPDFSKHSEELEQLYRLANNNLLWLGEDKPALNRETTLNILARADEEGLDPKDYESETLFQNFKLASAMRPNTTKEKVLYDTALSITLLRFVHDLHDGRIQSRELNYPSSFGDKKALAAANLIHDAIQSQSLAQLPQSAAPRFKQYQLLKQALANYRQQAKEPTFPVLVFETSLRPGEQHPQLAELKKRLVSLGVLSDQQASNETVYSGEMLEGVKKFQLQQGLQDDGIIGSETAALLNQTQDKKINRIELAMERLRWLPDQVNGPLILVNIPAFQLWAFNSLDDQQALNMKVIVGKAAQNQTPVLYEEMKYLEFMPFWNIPKSIMDKEILPKLMDDFAYLNDQDIELVERYSDGEDSTDGIFDEIKQGRVRARQRPGKNNPLGKVKFIFPNKEDVYLHDTPSHNLFNRNRRDLSHGCVRVAEADRLAEFVLSYQDGWDKAQIEQAMSGNKTQRVVLKQSIPVLFYYSTSFVDADNRLHFYRDIYGHDAALQKALGKSPKSINGSVLTSKNDIAG